MSKSTSKTLVLPVVSKYFQQIKARTKTEEFRAITPHWIKRIEGKEFDYVEITEGYPKAHDHARRIKRKWKGLAKVQGLVHEHFDNVPTDVFAIDVTGEDVTIDQAAKDAGTPSRPTKAAPLASGIQANWMM